MKYRNIKTGVTVNTARVLSGNIWEMVKDEEKEPAPVKKQGKKSKRAEKPEAVE